MMENVSAIMSVYSERFISFSWSIFWQSSILVGVIALTALLFRKASPRFRYYLWLLVLARLFLPPALPSRSYQAVLENGSKYSVAPKYGYPPLP